jgi:hypothetical protein
VKVREYRGLAAVFVAGALGISLLCSVSGMALRDLNESSTAVALAPADIVEAAVSNLNTAGAITLEAFAELAATSTPTLRPTQTVTATAPSLIPTAFRFPTLSGPTRTRRPRPDPTKTKVPPTRTAVPPTRTPIPPTNPPLPTRTPTDIPPLPTNTEPPVPTNTSQPPDTPPPPADTPTDVIPITGPTPGATPTP